MLFFSVHGFLIGYLMTRIYLAVLIKRADIQVIGQLPPIRLESGKQIHVRELAKLLQERVVDVEETLANLVVNTPTAAARPPSSAASESRAKTGRVLWVDDNPGNNTLLVEQLKREGNIVEQVLSTQQGLDYLARNQFDVVVTDIARTENAVEISDAGVNLTKQIRASHPGLPVLVYCSRRMARLYGGAAEAAGAGLVTTSGTELIAHIKSILAGPPQSPGGPTGAPS